MGKYLGLPADVGRNKKEVFAYIKDRVWNMVNCWHNKYLSKAGKEVLIRSVGMAIPSYLLGFFLLPQSLCDELEKILNGFWWDTGRQRGLRWLS